MAAVEAACSHVPDELWEFIFKFLSHDDHHTLKALSIVSKQFLSITNRLRFSLAVIDQTIPFLPRLFQRFPNLTLLNLILRDKNNYFRVNRNQISTFPIDIKSLYLSDHSGNFPDGIQPLSNEIRMLFTNCSQMCYIDKKDLVLVADCVPSRKEPLERSYPVISVNFKFQ
ncbi:uncharacterized protein LOC123921993 [Trifolium pratense]|uniref:uncharacterized protein LOC123921993 n=1 Tax=Trifolium pratense TaxID=57577 RepID=UPI001E690FAF|nr:uncharacterized protein LOC123921993 [Trifolium pratense]